MSFTATFWSFAKEVNSTKQPTGTGTQYSCVANSGTNIINPVIRIQAGLGGASSSPISYNYCQIPSFGNRYYFVENWEWSGGLWTAYLSVDVLATYKSGIGNLREYVLRSSKSYDGLISDAMYPAKNSWNYVQDSETNPWNWDMEAGTYCVGIVGSGSTQYYLFNYSGFTTFLRYILSDNYAEDVISSLALSTYPEAKAIIDPLQYIATVSFIPITASGLTDSITIPVGYVDVPATGKHCVGSYMIGTNVAYTSWTVPSHPQSATRGAYLNFPPFTSHRLLFYPFGLIDLDASMMPAGSTLSASLTIDYPTGNGELNVMCNNHMITHLKGKVGIDIQLGQVIAKGNGLLSIINKGANLVSQVMGGITGGGGTGSMVSNATHFLPEAPGASAAFSHIGMGVGAIVGGAASLASGATSWAMDAISNRIPSAHSTGTIGSFSEFVGLPCLYTEHAIIVDESLNTRGRPLCQLVQLSTLAADSTQSGYILVADPEIVGIAATATERNMIAQFLAGGFFYA